MPKHVQNARLKIKKSNNITFIFRKMKCLLLKYDIYDYAFLINLWSRKLNFRRKNRTKLEQIIELKEFCCVVKY